MKKVYLVINEFGAYHYDGQIDFYGAYSNKEAAKKHAKDLNDKYAEGVTIDPITGDYEVKDDCWDDYNVFTVHEEKVEDKYTPIDKD